MQKTDSAPGLPKVVDDCHTLLLWIIPALDKFPRNRRFTLGEKIESGLLEVLGNCVSAAYSRNKRDLLAKASRQLAIIQHLWRLAFELKALSQKSYRFGSQQLLAIGAQIGGWMKTARQ